MSLRKRYKLFPERNGGSNTLLEIEDLRAVGEDGGYIDLTMTFPGSDGHDLSVGLSEGDAEELVGILRRMLDDEDY